MQVHELGRGQFGRVWLARWRGVEVAVKEPRRGACVRARREALAEAAMLAALRHPCVTTLFGVLQEDVSLAAQIKDFHCLCICSGKCL